MSADFTPEKEDYGVLSPFKMQVLTNFPYIEADFDALTNYGLLCKIVEYLNNVIANENEVTEQVTSLYNAYVSLQAYVNQEIGDFESTVTNRVDGLESYMNNYFNNLDVQTEINNKLDAMTLDGSLTALISAYVDPIYQAYESSINNTIGNFNTSLMNMNSKVNALDQGAPLVASSTSEMTDTTKIYVNTTDGKWYYYDGDSWEIGGTYQSAEDSETVSQLEEIVNNYEALSNIVDWTNSVAERYINPTTGQYNTDESYTASYWQDASNIDSLYIEHTDQIYGAWYNAEHTYISGFKHEISGEGTYITDKPEGASVYKISGKTTYLSNLLVYPNEVVSLNKRITIDPDQINGEIKYTTLEVGTGHTYTTFRSAFANCIDPSETNRYIIKYYGNGTEYDISTEFTPEEQADSTFIGRRVPPYTKIMGQGDKERNIIGLRLPSGNAYLSTLCTYGSSELENLILIGHRVRYVLHDDYNTPNFERKFKNCDFIAVSTSYKAVVGAGSRSGDIMIFENCKFISQDDETSPYICHNNTGFTTSSTLLFINCRFINTQTNGLSVNLRSLNNNTSGIINNAYFYGCEINALSLIEENAVSYGAGIKWKVSGYGNNLKSEDVTIVNTDGQDYSSYVDLI